MGYPISALRPDRPQVWSAAWSQPSPAATPVVTLAEVKDWLGLYGDDSLDAEAQVCLGAALEKVESMANYKISSAGTTDYYPREATRLELSEPGIDAASIAVRYIGTAEDWTLLDAAHWHLDDSVEMPAVQLHVADRPVLGSSRLLSWRVEYSTSLAAVHGIHGVDRIKLAVRTAADYFWGLRGVDSRSSDTALLDRTLRSLLAGAIVRAV